MDNKTLVSSLQIFTIGSGTTLSGMNNVVAPPYVERSYTLQAILCGTLVITFSCFLTNVYQFTIFWLWSPLSRLYLTQTKYVLRQQLFYLK